jgi:hypothetical protein
MREERPTRASYMKKNDEQNAQGAKDSNEEEKGGDGDSNGDADDEDGNEDEDDEEEGEEDGDDDDDEAEEEEEDAEEEEEEEEDDDEVEEDAEEEDAEEEEEDDEEEADTEDTVDLFDAAKQVCPKHADLSFYEDLFLNPGSAMGVAYMVFMLALLVPVCKQLMSGLFIFAAQKRVQSSSGKMGFLAGMVADEAVAMAEAKADEQAETMEEEQEGLMDEASDGNDKSSEVSAQQDAAFEKHGDQNALHFFFAAIRFLLLLSALSDYLRHIPSGAGWECRVALIASAPLSKAISVPMWVVLLDGADVGRAARRGTVFSLAATPQGSNRHSCGHTAAR